jgi:predicted LPLAT superfamily acyltransferase
MATIKTKLELLGHFFFYAILKLFGQKSAYLLLYPTIFTYVLFSRKIHRNTAHYFQKRFPEHTRAQRFCDTFKNVFSFGQVLVDRGWLGMDKKADIHGEVIGAEKLLEVVRAGRGAVLVTAHVGNWQTALAKLDFLPVKVHALMQYDQFAAAKHYFDLGKKKRPFAIIDANGAFGGMIDATAALQRGEVVTIMSDRHTKGSTKVVDFLGEEVKLPDAAYTLAACVEAPVIVFLAAKTGDRKFELQVWDVFYPKFEERQKRHEVLQQCCQKFSSALQNYLQSNPYQWYNFYNIWDQANNESPQDVENKTNRDNYTHERTETTLKRDHH